MGSPTFWWYDLGATTFTSLQLPNLTRCERRPFRDVVDAEGWGVSRLDRGGGQLVRLGARMSTGQSSQMSAIRGLMTLDTHLRSGGHVMFAADAETQFCAPTVQPAYAGDTSLYVRASVLPVTSYQLSAGTELLIQTLNPLHYERVAMSADQVDQGGVLKFDIGRNLHRDVPEGSIIRQFRTFPTLYMDAATANSPERWLADDRYPNRIFEMDLTLVELPYEVAAVVQAQLASGSTRTDQGGRSLDAAIFEGLTGGTGPHGTNLTQAARAGLSGRWD